MDQPTTPNVGTVIDARREGVGLSRRELSTRTGIPNTTLDRRFRVGGFTIDELAAIADVLDTSVSALVAEAEGVAA